MRQVNMTGDNRFRKAMRSSGLRYAVLALALFLAARPGDAAVISVTNLNDSGAGSLRQAIAGAAANDTINFGVAGTITLTSGALAISKNLVISGPGSGKPDPLGQQRFKGIQHLGRDNNHLGHADKRRVHDRQRRRHL